MSCREWSSGRKCRSSSSRLRVRSAVSESKAEMERGRCIRDKSADVWRDTEGILEVGAIASGLVRFNVQEEPQRLAFES